MIELKHLYGGAINAYLPPNACDISQVRQVPDNQEVFAHPVTDQSIIFDLLQYESVPDEDAAKFHFMDLVGENQEAQVVSVRKLDINLPNCDSVYYLNGQQYISKYNEPAKNLVNLHLALLRLKQFETDILITFNDPIVINPQSSSFSATNTENEKWTEEQFLKTIETFRIADYSLFASN